MTPFTLKTLIPIALLWASVSMVHADSPPGATLSLSAEGSTQVVNELAVASMYYEASHDDPAELSRDVNRVISGALDWARGGDNVKIQSGGMNTYAVHARDDEGRQEVTGWRMRADIRLESEDLTAVSELIGQLQQDHQLNIASLSLHPTREARESAADAATLAAIKAFERRAHMLSQALGKVYEIRNLNVNYSGSQPPIRPMVRSAMLSVEDAAAPIEVGESEVTVHIDGTIGLLNNE